MFFVFMIKVILSNEILKYITERGCSFEITNVQAVQLNVFPENTRAKKCYESVGFVERKTDLNAFPYEEKDL